MNIFSGPYCQFQRMIESNALMGLESRASFIEVTTDRNARIFEKVEIHKSYEDMNSKFPARNSMGHSYTKLNIHLIFYKSFDDKYPSVEYWDSFDKKILMEQILCITFFTKDQFFKLLNKHLLSRGPLDDRFSNITKKQLFSNITKKQLIDYIPNVLSDIVISYLTGKEPVD